MKRILISYALIIASFLFCQFPPTVLFAQEITEQPEAADTTGLAAEDSIQKPSIHYEDLSFRDSAAADTFNPAVQTLSTKPYRYYYSVDDALDIRAGFESVFNGPYGQTSHLTFAGKPINGFRIGDFEYDYGSFAMPVNGLIDSRIIPPVESWKLYFPRSVYAAGFNTVSLYPMAYPDSGAITSAFMQKGDFGFSNTMVRFASSAGTRTRVGFSGSFKGSTGYLNNQKKDLENFRFRLGFQINDNIQLQPDILLYNSDDSIRFDNGFSNYRGESQLGFLGMSLGIGLTRGNSVFNRSVFIYQRFSESVRGEHSKYRYLSEHYKLKFENITSRFGFDHVYDFGGYFNSIRFEPDLDNYPGIFFNTVSMRHLGSNLSINLSSSSDLSEYGDIDLSLSGGLSYSRCPCMVLSGQIFRISQVPDEFCLFSETPVIEPLNREDNFSQYSFMGNSELSNTSYSGLSLGMQIDNYGIQSDIYLRYARVNDEYFWTVAEAGVSTLSSSPEAFDADWLSGGIDLETVLPFSLQTRLSYHYSKFSDNGLDLSLVPRHNAHISIKRNIFIPRFNLHIDAIAGGEYHSTNWESVYNRGRLDEYYLLNFQINLRIKSLTFYYNMDNVFDSEYGTIYDYELGRGIWWGFLWNFEN